MNKLINYIIYIVLIISIVLNIYLYKKLIDMGSTDILIDTVYIHFGEKDNFRKIITTKNKSCVKYIATCYNKSNDDSKFCKDLKIKCNEFIRDTYEKEIPTKSRNGGGCVPYRGGWICP